MYRWICKWRLFTSNLEPLSNSGNTHLPFLQPNSSHSFLKPFSSSMSPSSSSSAAASSAVTQVELWQSFVVSYLINSCGLSADRAVSLCRMYGRKLRFDSSEKPDSVINFLRSHGCNDAHIAGMVTSDPRVLLYTVEALETKFQFFYSIGFTKEDLPSFMSLFDIWRYRLDRYMIPLYGLLKDVLDSDKEVVCSLKRMGWLLQKSGYKSLKPNLTLLKEIGVPESKLALMLRNHPSDCLMEPVEFRKIVDEAKELGFDVSKSSFIQAIHALTSSYRTTRDRCSHIYKEWGFSRSDILCLFMKWPQSFLISEKKLRETLDFLVIKMGCQVQAITRFPQVLSLSLDKRIIPRCSVIHVLIQKGLFKRHRSLYSFLACTEEFFLDRYVSKYDDIASQLLMVYQGKLDPFKEPGI